ncbi:hypothetical protein [Nocardioides sp.]|uniref:hypothetical protein n=1 Tax=Nocardioides sp. TaxID=35761 RepID=UPI0027344F7E|nr:hypothetical protein [Nocardioides sp.]MDP3891936.1 hypothetical protein [Nocardioides sp.]
MPITTAGRNLITQMIVGTHSTNAYYGSTGAVLWVSTSCTAHDSAQTHLLGLTLTCHNSTMEATYPSIATNVLQFRGVLSTARGNIDWNEIGLTNATSTASGTMLFRLVSDFGAKTSTQTWQLTACATITT